MFSFGESFGETLKGQAQQLHRKFTPPSLPEKGGILFGSTESMFGSASEIHVLVLVGSNFLINIFVVTSYFAFVYITIHLYFSADFKRISPFEAT